MKSFDPKCLELSEHFLPAAPINVQEELAQRIQDEVEDYISGLGPHPEVTRNRQ